MKNSRKTMKLPRYESTYQGLHGSYKHAFERLGWTVLSHAKGLKTKVSEYKRSVDRLIKSIETVKKEYKDHNRIHDLNVLLENAKVLQAHVQKDF